MRKVNDTYGEVTAVGIAVGLGAVVIRVALWRYQFKAMIGDEISREEIGLAVNASIIDLLRLEKICQSPKPKHCPCLVCYFPIKFH
jgi:hypothetical protein